MGVFDFLKHKQTLDEAQEEDDRLAVEQSKSQRQAEIAKNKYAILEYKKRGGDISAVTEGGKININKVWQWLRAH